MRTWYQFKNSKIQPVRKFNAHSIWILCIDIISSNFVVYTCESTRATRIKRVQVSRAPPWLFVGRVSHWKCKTQSRAEISFQSFVLRMNETFQRLSRLHTELILIVSRRRDVQFGARLAKCFNYICMLRLQYGKVFISAKCPKFWVWK